MHRPGSGTKAAATSVDEAVPRVAVAGAPQTDEVHAGATEAATAGRRRRWKALTARSAASRRATETADQQSLRPSGQPPWEHGFGHISFF